jgi:hypothetical protein
MTLSLPNSYYATFFLRESGWRLLIDHHCLKPIATYLLLDQHIEIGSGLLMKGISGLRGVIVRMLWLSGNNGGNLLAGSG